MREGFDEQESEIPILFKLNLQTIYTMNTHLLKFAAVSLLVLAAGCSKDSDPKPLATPEPRFKAQSTVTEYSFFWNPIEHADTYSYKLETADGVVVAENAAYTETLVTISDLKEESTYNFHVTALSKNNPDYAPSATASVTFTTGAIPRVASPEFKSSCKTDVGACATWLPSSGKFSYDIAAKDAPETSLNAATIEDPYVTFAGLKPNTSYILKVKNLAEEGSGYSDSKESVFEFTTEPAATAPWTEVVFEFRPLAEKNTIFCHNVPNSAVEHYYSTTEDHNVIGSGQADEATYAKYLIFDYEDNVPGIYCDYPLNKFGNGAVGWKKGDKLFYAVVSADKGEKTKTTNWFYVEMPEKADEDIIILDSHKK